MHPRNELSEVTTFDCEIITRTLARFTISLSTHPHLRNPELLKRCMDDLVALYPNATGWGAVINGNLLIIDAEGTIDPRYYGE